MSFEALIIIFLYLYALSFIFYAALTLSRSERYVHTFINTLFVISKLVLDLKNTAQCTDVAQPGVNYHAPMTLYMS